MADVIDLRDLPEDQVKFIQKLVESLKKKSKIRKKRGVEAIAFATWPLGVKGKLARKEIYDYL